MYTQPSSLKNKYRAKQAAVESPLSELIENSLALWQHQPTSNLAQASLAVTRVQTYSLPLQGEVNILHLQLTKSVHNLLAA